MLAPLTSQIVGSYAKPHWLADHARMRATDGSFWRPAPELLAEAREDAARLAIYEQERAGLALVTDGEAQRAAYDRHFLTALSGIALDRFGLVPWGPGVPGTRRDSEGFEEYARLTACGPAVVGPIQWQASAAAGELRFLQSVARRPVKVAVIGPLSLSRSLHDLHYHDEPALVLDLAAALNCELLALQAAGADVLQVDEPHWHGHLDLARRVGVAAMTRLLQGITTPVQAHVCYGYARVVKDKRPNPLYAEVLELLAATPVQGISLEYEQPGHSPDLLRHCGSKHVILGLLDMSREAPESAAHIAARLRAAMRVVAPERLHPASDCGMWHLPRPTAFARLCALADATREVKAELGAAG